MIVQRMGGSRGRGSGRDHIGQRDQRSQHQLAQMAKAYGMYSEGPIDNPSELGRHITAPSNRVRAGEPRAHRCRVATSVMSIESSAGLQACPETW